MTDKIKRTLYRLDKGFSLVLYKARAPIALPSILISKIEDKCLLNARQMSYTLHNYFKWYA